MSFNVGHDLYRFDHSIEKTAGLAAEARLHYGTDCFCQIVLSLEDIARMTERGIYKLQQWIEGMKALPAGVTLPDFLVRLGFDHEPASEEEINEHWRPLAKQYHPDAGGNEVDFKRLEDDRQRALDWLHSKEVHP